MRLVLAALACAAALSVSAASASERDLGLERAIDAARPVGEPGVCFSYVLEDLDADGRPEALVHVTDFRWCGTAGCPLCVYRWRDRWLSKVSCTIMIRDVFLEPWTKRGWRPLVVEKHWGFWRVPWTRRGYPAEVTERNSSPLKEVPPEARPLDWSEPKRCVLPPESRPATPLVKP